LGTLFDFGFSSAVFVGIKMWMLRKKLIGWDENGASLC